MVSAMRRLCLQKSTLRMGSENGCTKIYGEKTNRLQNSKIVVPASVHGVAAAAIGFDIYSDSVLVPPINLCAMAPRRSRNAILHVGVAPQP